MQVREESLAAHEQRLAELRALVAQIAADVGLPPDGLLAAEVATLGHKLEDVRESLATLADSADTRLSCGEDLLQAKAFLDTVHKVGLITHSYCSPLTCLRVRGHRGHSSQRVTILLLASWWCWC